MLVAFNPMVNTGASASAAYVNFLRCVRAIATAPAGTSSLTVNPFTNNTGTIDNTRNCIVSILSNTEAGGWTESSVSNVPQSGAFTAYTALTGYSILFDAWAPSGKGTAPFLKFTLSTMGGATTDPLYAQLGNSTISTGYSFVPIMCTFGYSSSNDWTDTKYPPGGGVWATAPNNGIGTGPSAKTSISHNINGWYGNTQGSGSYNPAAPSAFIANDPNRIFYLSITANYIIMWEQHINNSYLNGYGNTLTSYVGTGGLNLAPYGTLWACGFREAQAWENSYANNPPIYSMWITHQRSYAGAASNSGPHIWNGIWAPLLTIDNSGVIGTTLGTGLLYNNGNSGSELFGNPVVWNTTNNNVTALNSTQSSLDQPVLLREIGATAATRSNMIYKPGVDNTTGIAVPAAYPVMIRRSASGSWTNGGAARGIYKSLTMPIATMRNYFANGQTFTIFNSVTNTNDVYLPIVFNEDMWLVRYA